MKVTTRIAGIAVVAALMVSLGGAASASSTLGSERTTVTSTEHAALGAAADPRAGVRPAAIWGWCAHNTIETGVPTTCFYKDLQGYVLRSNGYTGAIDGIMGTNSWKAMQRWLSKGNYYTGAIDGIAGAGTKKALQKYLAHMRLYKGPIDGILGKATWRALAVEITTWMD